jgi:hypothetical protein
MVAELATLMPEEGGYYVWVREALGPAWGVQQACCTMTTAVVWLAMYPVLFVSYLAFFFPGLGVSDVAHPGWSALLRWAITVLVIGSGMALNLRGAHEVGSSAKLSTYFVLGVFVLFLLIWIVRTPSAGSFASMHPQRSCVRSQGSFAAGAFGRHLQLLRMGQCFHLCWRGGRTTTQLPTGHGHRASGPGSLVPAAGARGDHDHDKSRSLEFGCRLASHLAVDGRKMAWLTGGCSGIGVDVGII